MNDQRYSADLIVTAQDFTECDWKSSLADEERESYSSMWQAFSSAARKASEDNRPSHGKALWLLVDACSMMLSPKSINEPFKPFMVMEGRRSVIPDDLSESDITFYAEIIDAIDDAWLKARVADLVWLRQRRVDELVAIFDEIKILIKAVLDGVSDYLSIRSYLHGVNANTATA